MKKVFSLFFFLLLGFSVKAQNIPISDSLIYKMSVLKVEDYVENLDEHEKLTQQLSKEIISHTSQKKDSVFGALVVLYDNFDADADNELIIFMGYVWESEVFAFDKIDNQWFLIYREDITLGNSLDLDYGISPVKDTPLIRVKHRAGGGTGMYMDEYFFYRFTKNGFKKVLTLGGKHWVSSGSILYLNFNLNTQFYTYSFGGIEIFMESKYYLPHYDNNNNPFKEVILFEEDLTFNFEWNERKEEYQITPSKDSSLSIEQKKFLISQQENQNLFYQLFKAEIKETRKTLSKEETEILDKWIEYVEKSMASKK